MGSMLGNRNQKTKLVICKKLTNIAKKESRFCVK